MIRRAILPGLVQNGFWRSEEIFRRSPWMSALFSDNWFCSNLPMSIWAYCLQRLSPKLGALSDLHSWTNIYPKFETWGNRQKVMYEMKYFDNFWVLLKKAGAGHFTESAPGFLSRFHWWFLAQNLIFYGYQKSSEFKHVSKF